jgi:protein NrfC
MIDDAKCVGCQLCVNACPQLPHRIIWNPAKRKASKCDMCVNTPFHTRKGGPDGLQACVEACPANSLRVVADMPEQADLRGYDRRLQPLPKPKAAPKPKEAAPDAKVPGGN